MKTWTIKLPSLVGVVFLILSLPFILGSLHPSIHEGGYSALYAIVNIPAIIVVAPLGEWLFQAFGVDLDPYLINLITILLFLVFWVSVSFMIGLFIDSVARE